MMMGNSCVHVLRLTFGDCQPQITLIFGVFRALAGLLCLWQTVTKAFLLFNRNNGVSTQAWSAVYYGRLVPQGDEVMQRSSLVIFFM